MQHNNTRKRRRRSSGGSGASEPEESEGSAGANNNNTNTSNVLCHQLRNNLPATLTAAPPRPSPKTHKRTHNHSNYSKRRPGFITLSTTSTSSSSSSSSSTQHKQPLPEKSSTTTTANEVTNHPGITTPSNGDQQQQQNVGRNVRRKRVEIPEDMKKSLPNATATAFLPSSSTSSQNQQQPELSQPNPRKDDEGATLDRDEMVVVPPEAEEQQQPPFSGLQGVGGLQVQQHLPQQQKVWVEAEKGLPCDWSLKTKVTFLSSSTFDWCNSCSAKVEAEATLGYIRSPFPQQQQQLSPNLKSTTATTASLSTSSSAAVVELLESLSYFSHPSTLLPNQLINELRDLLISATPAASQAPSTSSNPSSHSSSSSMRKGDGEDAWTTTSSTVSSTFDRLAHDLGVNGGVGGLSGLGSLGGVVSKMRERERELLGMWQTRQREWVEAFRSVYFLMRNGECPFFYLQFGGDISSSDSNSSSSVTSSSQTGGGSHFSVLFLSGGVAGGKKTRAYISRSSHGLRHLLLKSDVEFSTPLNPRIASSEVARFQQQQNNTDAAATPLADISQPDINFYGVEFLQPSSGGGGVPSAVETLLKFEGHTAVHGLFDFLINMRKTAENDLPVIYSPVCFLNGALKRAQIRSIGEVSRPRKRRGERTTTISNGGPNAEGEGELETCFRLVVMGGVLLPSNLQRLFGIVHSTQRDPSLTMSLVSHPQTTSFNVYFGGATAGPSSTDGPATSEVLSPLLTTATTAVAAATVAEGLEGDNKPQLAMVSAVGEGLPKYLTEAPVFGEYHLRNVSCCDQTNNLLLSLSL